MVQSNDPCRCDHDFMDHQRTIGNPPFNQAKETDMACDICGCDDFIPTPHSNPGPALRGLDYARPRL